MTYTTILSPFKKQFLSNNSEYRGKPRSGQSRAASFFEGGVTTISEYPLLDNGIVCSANITKGNCRSKQKCLLASVTLVIKQQLVRQMAMLFSMSVYHPDIIKFINAKAEEGRIENANLSVMVDDNFMRMVEQDKTYWTQFNGEKYNEYRARDIFDMIVEGMWRTGEPKQYWAA